MEQNEQHIKDLEKNKSQMSGVEVAATDSSEKVSQSFEEAANYVTRHSERMWPIRCVDSFFFPPLTLGIHHLSDLSTG